MLSRVKGWLKRDRTKELKLWYSRIIPSKSLASSAFRCCLSVADGKIFMVYAQHKADKAKIIFYDSFDYKLIKDIRPILTKIVQQYNLTQVSCSLILKADQFQLLQTESLPVPPNEFQAAIRWKVKDLLRFPLEDAIIDSFPLPQAKLPTSLDMLMLVVARASIVKPIVEQIKGSGLNINTIDIPELSLRNIAALYEQDEKSTTTIYIQENESELILTQGQKIYFIRRLDLSLKSVGNAIKNKDKSDELHTFVDKAALEIQRSFDYFQSQWRQPEPNRIILATFMPWVSEFAALLGERLKATIMVLDLNAVFEDQLDVKIKLDASYVPLLGGILREWDMGHATTD